jgi:hypothetical protein
MINLAGNKEADKHIQEELTSAGIISVKATGQAKPYSYSGKLDEWTFERDWAYWIANAKDGKGLPLEVAIELHEKKYPIEGDNEPKTYGRVVRVGGSSGETPPKQWARPGYDDLMTVMRGLGWACIDQHQIVRLYDEGKIQVPMFVHTYHIDTQIGLNEFARVIHSLKK